MNSPNGKLSGKIAVVTGGAGSVGSAIVRTLAGQGATVFVNCFHSYHAAKDMVASMRGDGMDVHVLRGSVAVQEQVQRMFDRVADDHGRLDILVNNAAAGAFGALEDVTADALQRSLDVNLKGALWCVQAARPLLVASGGGAVVNVSAIGTTRVAEGYLMVAVAKAGLEVATKYLAVELGKDNIRVNTASAGVIDNATIDLFPDPRKLRDAALANTPLGGLGKPQDLANVVALLVSPESAWITGQTLLADGGASLPDGTYRRAASSRQAEAEEAVTVLGEDDQQEHGDPIAIVSMGLAVPGASTPDEFWTLLNEGRELFVLPPADRWHADDVTSADPAAVDKTYQSKAGFITDFTPDSRLEQEPLAGDTGADPLTLWLRHCLYQALEKTVTATGDRTVLCLGYAANTSQFLTDSSATDALLQALDFGELGEFDEAEAERIRKVVTSEFGHDGDGRSRSYLPRALVEEAMRGILPADTKVRLVDTACASALYALDLGIRDLRSGRADIAVCGGMEGYTAPSAVLFSKLGGLSATGAVRSLDSAADGVLFSEAAGVVVLKRLSKALADGDQIHGVIAGVGLSTDGRGKAIYAPAEEGQLLALRRAFQESDVRPDDVELVVAHATGTRAGDKTEIAALRKAYSTGKRVWVTSNKSLIGHPGWAAGVTSMIHLLLAMGHGTIPPQYRLREENAEFDAQEKSDLAVPTEPVSWRRRAGKGRVGAVSSMGFGGTNAHIVVQEYLPHVRYAPKPARAPERLAIVGWAESSGVPEVSGWRIPGAAAKRMDRAQLLMLDCVLRLDDQILRLCQEQHEKAGVVVGHHGLLRNNILSSVRCYQDRILRSLREHDIDADKFSKRLTEWIDPLHPAPNEDTMPSEMANVIASRVTNYFNLRGLSVAVDDGANSLAEALDVAASYLVSADLDIALVGAVNGNLLPSWVKRVQAAQIDDQTESAVVFAITRESSAREQGIPVLAVLEPGEPLPADGPWALNALASPRPVQDRWVNILEPQPAVQVRPLQQLIPPNTLVLTNDVELLAGRGLPTGTTVLDAGRARPGLETDLSTVIGRADIHHVRIIVDQLGNDIDTVLAAHDALFLVARACATRRVADLIVVLLGGMSPDGVPGALTGLFTGALKSLELDLPSVRMLVVAHDASGLATAWPDVEAESTTHHGLPAVYFAGGTRFVEVLRPTPPELAAVPLHRDSVVLAAGGGYGIGAEMLKGLARTAGPRIYILGSTELPDPGGPAPLDRHQYILRRTADPDRVSPGVAASEFEQFGRVAAIRATLSELGRHSGSERVAYLRCDLRDRDQVRQVVSQVLGEADGVDLLLHTAGTMRFVALQKDSLDGFREIRDAKVRGYFNLKNAFGDNQPHRWINVGSIGGFTGLSGGSAYSAANDFLRTAAAHAAGHGGHESTIGFGIWGEAGFAAGPIIQEFAQREGWTPISTRDGVAKFLTEVSQPEPTNTVMTNPDPQLPVGKSRQLNGTLRRPATFLIDEAVVSRASLTAYRDFDLDRDSYLNNHLVSGHPTLPATLTLELAAEAACLLVPQLRPVGFRDVVLHRFIRVFRDKGLQRKKIKATLLSPEGSESSVRVSICQDITAPDGRVLIADQELADLTVLMRAEPLASINLRLQSANDQIPLPGPSRFQDSAVQLSGIFASIEAEGYEAGQTRSRLRLDGVGIARLLPDLVLPSIMLDALLQTASLMMVADGRQPISVPSRIARLDLFTDRNDVALGRDGAGVTMVADAPLLDVSADRLRGKTAMAVTDGGEVLVRLEAYEAQVIQYADVETTPGTSTGGMRSGQGGYLRDRSPRSTVELFDESVSSAKRLSRLESLGVPVPYFVVHDGIAADTTRIAGRDLVAFSSYNYLSLSGHRVVADAAKSAVDTYGTSVSASRPLADRPPLVQFERELAEFLGAEAAVTIAGGFLCNVAVIDTVVGEQDLIVHDSLAHISIMQGAKLSGATVRSFPHNDMTALDGQLTRFRERYRRVLIVVEGVYSVDGDLVDLPALIAVKRKHDAMVMIDEAHSMGVVGQTGRGVAEHFGIERSEVEIWSGTLSKAFASFGGYVAGTSEMAQFLKWNALGFQFSASLPAGVAAAALASLRILKDEPERVHRLQRNAKLFLDLAKYAGLNTGLSNNSAVIPCIVGDEEKTILLADRLQKRGIDANPMVAPATTPGQERVRFFVCSTHTEKQIRTAVDVIADELGKLSG
ncbi:SDR family oxidoreductase [Kribbella antibiotica]|uniref:SDR family oxidoreductase n=1 Tax=Kribbella antibiotica TaxID=190195 RepID=A0A4R4ZTB6_9ACTN|nr:SDR family oxidoreductase [Kribbella antibiotica]TDD61680.1 SDR family oxidoreductase [Kribbella antibiotica]